MSNNLVVYFSASGITAGVAEKLAEAIGADICEIKPEVPYTKADLNWMNKNSRSSVEMKDLSSRPAMVKPDLEIEKYDTIYLGFPIWWYVAPTIVNTFLEAYDWTGKTIVIFATSGSSDFGDTLAKLKDSCPGATLTEGEVFKRLRSKKALTEWIESLK